MVEHGLTISYKEEHVKILEGFLLSTPVESLLVSIEKCDEKIILVLVYYPSRQQVSTFINGMISIFRDILKGEQIILLGHFNLDQKLQKI